MKGKKYYASKSINRKVTAGQLRSDIPAFRAGDTVRVHALVFEGTRERVQIFEGWLSSATVLVSPLPTRYVRSVTGFGVERTFPLHSPRVKRSKLYATVVYAVLSSTSVNGLVRVPALLNVVA